MARQVGTILPLENHKTNTHYHTHTRMYFIHPTVHHRDAPRTNYKLTDDLASHTKQIDKQQLAKLARLGNAESAGRMFRGIKAKIIAALVDLTAVPGTPTNGAGGDDAATAAAADPESPSELASQKKKKKTAGGGKVAGRKRTMKEADDGGSGDEGGKNEGEGGERPKKVAKHVKGKPVVTSKKLKAAEGGADDFEAGEV